MARAALAPAVEASGFGGIGPGAYAFLDGLSENNERGWFLAHKADYDTEILAPVRALVAAVSDRLQELAVPLVGDPLKAVFRPNRDVRFSRDKRPYKTETGAVLSRDGSKNSNGVLYIHIGSRGGFTACGFYQPDPADLQALRTAIAARPKVFDGAMTGIELSAEDTLTRMPRGFEQHAHEPFAPVLRLRNLVALRGLSRADLAGPGAVELIAAHAAACRKLLEFGWSATHGVVQQRRV